MAKILIVIYLLPIIAALLLVFPDIRQFIKSIRTQKAKADSSSSGKGTSVFWGGEQHVPIDKLQGEKVYLWHETKLVFGAIFFALNFPVVVFRLAIVKRFGVRVTWKLPVSFYDLWSLLFLALAFYSTSQRNFYAAVYFNVFPLSSALFMIGHYFSNEDGKLVIMLLPRHKVNIRMMIEPFIIIVLAFGSIYFSLSAYYPDSFSKDLYILDSVYYSVTTVATVGYGDIKPESDFAKILTMTEIVIGYVYAVMFIGIFISVYINKLLGSNKKNIE